MSDKNYPKHTSLTINNRNMLLLNGVINIEVFDEGYVTLLINEGKLDVEGAGLKIESLSRDNGEIVITGDISGVYYSRQKNTKGILSKIFG